MMELKFRNFYRESVNKQKLMDIIRMGNCPSDFHLYYMQNAMFFDTKNIGRGSDMEENKKLVQVRCTITALSFFLSIYLLQCVAVLFGILIFQVMGMDTKSNTFIIFVSMLGALFSLAWCGYWYEGYRTRSEDFSYRKAFSGARILALSGIGVGGCVSISILLTLLHQIVPSWFENYQDTMSNFTQGNQILTILYVLLIGPVSEEIIFRGVIMNRLCQGFPFMAANLVQAALFGVYHKNLVQAIYAFVLGFVFGMVWLMTETIVASIGVHILFNATNVLLQQIFPVGKPVSLALFYMVFLLCVLLFSAGLWYTIRNCFIEEDKNSNTVH